MTRPLPAPRIFDRPPSNWRELQELVAQAFREMGCEAAVEQTIQLPRGTVVVDVAISDGTTAPPSTYICECKHWRRPVSKAEVHAFRTVLAEIGANRGLLISTSGFQAGAVEATKFTNVDLLTWSAFESMYFDRWAVSCALSFNSSMRRVFAMMDTSNVHLWSKVECTHESWEKIEAIANANLVFTYWALFHEADPAGWLSHIASFAPEDERFGRLDTVRKVVDACPAICTRVYQELVAFWSERGAAA
jgi:hypothetical protein